MVQGSPAETSTMRPMEPNANLIQYLTTRYYKSRDLSHGVKNTWTGSRGNSLAGAHFFMRPFFEIGPPVFTVRSAISIMESAGFLDPEIPGAKGSSSV